MMSLAVSIVLRYSSIIAGLSEVRTKPNITGCVNLKLIDTFLHNLTDVVDSVSFLSTFNTTMLLPAIEIANFKSETEEFLTIEQEYNPVMRDVMFLTITTEDLMTDLDAASGTPVSWRDIRIYSPLKNSWTETATEPHDNNLMMTDMITTFLQVSNGKTLLTMYDVCI